MVRVDQRKEIKRMKKRVTTLLLTGVLMVMSSVPAMAAARIAVGPCPKCGVQACSTTTSTGYEHDEQFACKHGKSGYDRYKVYKIVTRKNCSNCGYSNSTTTERHDFYKCEGH